jgi:Bacterial Ig-like domain (group 3)/FG-GAP-like repeat
MRSFLLVCFFLILAASLSAQSHSSFNSEWPLRPPILTSSHAPSTSPAFSAQSSRSARAASTSRAAAPVTEPTLDASGIFLEAPLYNSGGFEAESLVTADVNGDGIPDIVVANSCSSSGECGSNGSVDVLLGNGDGTFQSAVSYSSGGVGPFSLALADLNNDGKLDIVVANLFSSTVGVLLGNGDGTFQSPTTYSSGGDEAVSVAVKDINGDNKPDIIVANLCAAGSNCASTGSVTILFGNGNGTFSAAGSYSSGGYFAESVAVEDLNGDGKPDIVVADYCSSSNACSAGGVIGVLLNNGNGTFQSAATFGSGGDQPLFVTIADVNGDKKPDIIVGNSCANCSLSGEGSVGVLLGNGNGTFQSALSYDSGGFTAASVAVRDVNNDGYPDLLVANQSTETTPNSALGVLLSNGNGTFEAPVTYNLAGDSAESIALVDVNGDNNPDAIVSNFYEYACNLCAPGAISVALGNGDGTFQAASNYLPGGINTQSSAAADVNNDGNLDLVVANECPSTGPCTNGTVAVLLGNGSGTFQPPLSYSSGGIQADSVTVADLNDDGNKDIVVANYCASTDCSAASVGVLLGNGDGTFQTAVTYNSGGYGAVSVAIKDVNGDNIPDIIVANSCVSSGNCSIGSVAILLGNGDGTFQSAVTYNSGGVFAESVSVADLNGDNRPDLIVANSCGQGLDCFDGPNTGGVAVLFNKGNGTFRPAVSYATGGANAVSAAVADMNGDGKPDLVVANNCSIITFSTCPGGSIAILLGIGNGKFQPATAFTTPLAIGGGQLAVADFNGDGKPDVASGVARFLLLGNGDGTLQTPVYLGTSGSAVTTGFFNNDGTPDLAVGGATILLNRTAASNVTLTSSHNPSTYGQSTTLTATVSGDTPGTPTGKVTFVNQTTILGTVSLSNGIAVLTYSALAAGMNALNAIYSGDSHFNPSTSAAFSQKVRAASTTTTIESSANPAPPDQAVTYTATVKGQNGGAVSGSVIFKDNGTVTTVPLSGATATLALTYSISSAHLVTATYSGDSNNASSVSATLKEYVEILPVATKTVVKSSGSPSHINQPVTFTASVTSSFGKIPNGESVTFFDGSNPIGIGPITGGIATFTTSSLIVGAHTITATYAGDPTFATSSGTTPQVVTLYESTTKLTSTPNPSNQGQPVTLTATVSSAAPGGSTGDVTFRNGAAILGTSPITNGAASLTTSALPRGTLSITANYKGNNLTLPSSRTTTQTVH